MRDKTCLAENAVYDVDFNKTGINQNELIVGATGSGKSWSCAYSRLAHILDSSVVIPISKNEIKNIFMPVFKERGYEIVEIDFTNPEKSKSGYDPMDWVNSDEDIIHLATSIVKAGGKSFSEEPFWDNSAISMHAAEMGFLKLNEKDSGKRTTYADVIKLHKSIEIYSTDRIHTNLDDSFNKLEKIYPNNQASQLWKTFKCNPIKTGSCIYTTLNSSIDKIFSKSICDLTKKDDRIDFKSIGERKTAVFITTSPFNMTLKNYVNILYSDLFRVLFEQAQQSDSGQLNVPVHIICDDFACGTRITGFEDYISIFRAAGISVSLLLQSESQLNTIYGEYAAQTIINNCDTYVYMGGMDPVTCRRISDRLNIPLHKVMDFPLEQVVVMRRGSKPIVSKRYQILKDEEYQKILTKYKAMKDKPKKSAKAREVATLSEIEDSKR